MDYKRPSHWAKLPPAPTNPFPRETANSWAGIYLEDWKNALSDFLGKYTEFREEDHDAAGRPGYHWQWRSVMARKNEIMTHTQPDRQEFRASLQYIVDKTDHVDTAVCLALGKFENAELRAEEAFQHQLAMFLVLCEMLEIKQNTKIKTIFQDPRFEPPEEYVITLAGGEVVKHPGALEHMTENSFVFAPYLVWPAFPDTIIKKHPALYIGNKVESGGGMGIPIAERYVRQFYVTGKREMGPDLQEIIDQTKKFADSYDKYLFDATTCGSIIRSENDPILIMIHLAAQALHQDLLIQSRKTIQTMVQKGMAAQALISRIFRIGIKQMRYREDGSHDSQQKE
ncbi:hypothetical protein D6C79_08277 [Aureobasidium pullulans]|nr:hypothetical protein D6C79_08277 [Aureobasidium pullulans]